MRKGGGFIGNRTQAKTLCGVEIRTAQAAIIPCQAFGLPVFKEKFPVFRRTQRIIDLLFKPVAIKVAIGEKQAVGFAQIGHETSLRACRMATDGRLWPSGRFSPVS
jgi:hypothetical protein